MASRTRPNTNELSSTIQGWGVDLNPENRPAVPKEKSASRDIDVYYTPYERQIPRIKIHKSPEHRHLTVTFGTSCPPKGLSGLLRDLAYKFSEGRMSHWLILLAADRVDVAESFVIDLLKGRLENPLSEMGLSAEWKRHGLRSRVREHRANVWSRLPKNVLLIAGLTAVAVPSIRRRVVRRVHSVRQAA